MSWRRSPEPTVKLVINSQRIVGHWGPGSVVSSSTELCAEVSIELDVRVKKTQHTPRTQSCGWFEGHQVCFTCMLFHAELMISQQVTVKSICFQHRHYLDFLLDKLHYFDIFKWTRTLRMMMFYLLKLLLVQWDNKGVLTWSQLVKLFIYPW